MGIRRKTAHKKAPKRPAFTSFAENRCQEIPFCMLSEKEKKKKMKPTNQVNIFAENFAKIGKTSAQIISDSAMFACGCLAERFQFSFAAFNHPVIIFYVFLGKLRALLFAFGAEIYAPHAASCNIIPSIICATFYVHSTEISFSI